MLDYLIISMCLSISPVYNQACNQALNATVISTHIKGDLDTMQGKLQKNIETEVYKKVNRDVAVAMLGIYQVYTKSSFVFNVPIKPIADSLSGNIGKDSSTINLTWAF